MNLLEKFSDLNVLVIGDVMLDRYWWGSVKRISPEAPVPVVNLENITATLGGAANVAANIVGLGAKVRLIGVTGDDRESNLLSDILDSKLIASDLLVKSGKRQTTVKTRIIAHSQQIVRIDQETAGEIDFEIERTILEKFRSQIETADVVVISDYAKGVLTDNLISSLITQCDLSGKTILVDP